MDQLEKHWADLRSGLQRVGCVPLMCVDLERILADLAQTKDHAARLANQTVGAVNLREAAKHVNFPEDLPGDMKEQLLQRFDNLLDLQELGTQGRHWMTLTDAELIEAGETMDAGDFRKLYEDELDNIIMGTYEVSRIVPQVKHIFSEVCSQDPWLLLFPTSKSWHIPAILRFGGWNSCPPPQVHVAQLKDWNERFEAELVALKPDSIWLQVTRPITDWDEAMAVAQEHYLYCSELHDQALPLSDVASQLVDATSWFFWWD